jgi:hypothetical protein
MALIKVYSASIRVWGVQGAKSLEGGVQDLPRKEAEEFVKKVFGMLDKVRKLKTGKALIAAMDATGHQCHIFRSTMTIGFDAAAKAYPETVANSVNARVRSFRPEQLNVATDFKTEKFMKGYEKDLAGTSAPRTISDAAPELANILLRATRAGFTRQGIATKVGITPDLFRRMEQGLAPIDDNTYWKLAFLLYDFMKPGPGTSTQIRHSGTHAARAVPGGVNVEELPGGKAPKFNPKKTWEDVPDYITMGHELVHAWRMMAGKRLVRDGWEEEAMTTGIPPFLYGKFTENMLRLDARLPMRPIYACRAINSNWMEDQRAISGKGHETWATKVLRDVEANRAKA